MADQPQKIKPGGPLSDRAFAPTPDPQTQARELQSPEEQAEAAREFKRRIATTQVPENIGAGAPDRPEAEIPDYDEEAEDRAYDEEMEEQEQADELADLETEQTTARELQRQTIMLQQQQAEEEQMADEQDEQQELEMQQAQAEQEAAASAQPRGASSESGSNFFDIKKFLPFSSSKRDNSAMSQQDQIMKKVLKSISIMIANLTAGACCSCLSSVFCALLPLLLIGAAVAAIISAF